MNQIQLATQEAADADTLAHMINYLPELISLVEPLPVLEKEINNVQLKRVHDGWLKWLASLSKLVNIIVHLDNFHVSRNLKQKPLIK
jgi:hypothetical protein